MGTLDYFIYSFLFLCIVYSWCQIKICPSREAEDDLEYSPLADCPNNGGVEQVPVDGRAEALPSKEATNEIDSA